MTQTLYNGIVGTLILIAILVILWHGKIIMEWVKRLLLKDDFRNLETRIDILTRSLETCTKSELQVKQRLEVLEAGEKILNSGSWSWDLTTEPDEVTYSNNFARLFDVIPGQMITARALLDVVHIDDRDAVHAKIKECFDTGEPYQVDYRIVRRNDRNDLVRCWGTPVMNANGRPIKINGVIQLLKVDVD